LPPSTTFLPILMTTVLPPTSLPSTSLEVTTSLPQEAALLPRLPSSERMALLLRLDLDTVEPGVLSSRQRAALEQELELRELGLQPFSDPSPWQRLTRDQQLLFNEKYLALRADVQEFARQMFLNVSEERQEHAFAAFLSLEVDTLTVVLEREMVEEEQVRRAALARQEEEQEE